MKASDSIKNSHCFLHPQREAVALCLSCSQFFCRECVTEHKGRVLCKTCLSKELGKSRRMSRVPFFIRAALAILLGLLMCYILFYSLGYTLSLIPDTFHQGTYLEKK